MFMTALWDGLTDLFNLQIEVHRRERDPLNPPDELRSHYRT